MHWGNTAGRASSPALPRCTVAVRRLDCPPPLAAGPPWAGRSPALPYPPHRHTYSTPSVASVNSSPTYGSTRGQHDNCQWTFPLRKSGHFEPSFCGQSISPLTTGLHASAPDAVSVIPPQHNARIWQHGNTHAPPHPRDEAVRFIRTHGRRKWKTDLNYHQRSLAETAVFRFKTIFGDQLSTRSLVTQATQFGARCRALNIMTHLGMPDSYKVD